MRSRTEQIKITFLLAKKKNYKNKIGNKVDFKHEQFKH